MIPATNTTSACTLGWLKSWTRLTPRKPHGSCWATPDSGPHRDPVFVRVGKYGPYIEQGERKASIPDGLPPDEMDLAKAMELLESSEVKEEPIGTHPETGKPIYVKVGRFGPYIQLGENDDEEKRNQGLLRGMEVPDLTLGNRLQTARVTANARRRIPRTISRFRRLTDATDPTSSVKRKPGRCRQVCRRWTSASSRRSSC